MRFLLSAAIWLVLIGGLWVFTSQRDAGVVQTPRTVVDHTAQGSFAIEVTTTFTLEDDPFAIQTDNTKSTGMDLRLNGRRLALAEEKPSRGQTIRMDKVEGVLQGHNEVYVQASPPVAESHLEQGLRIKFFVDGNLIADRTFWSSSGATISDSLSFDYPTGTGGETHDRH